MGHRGHPCCMLVSVLLCLGWCVGLLYLDQSSFSLVHVVLLCTVVRALVQDGGTRTQQHDDDMSCRSDNVLIKNVALWLGGEGSDLARQMPCTGELHNCCYLSVPIYRRGFVACGRLFAPSASCRRTASSIPWLAGSPILREASRVHTRKPVSHITSLIIG